MIPEPDFKYPSAEERELQQLRTDLEVLLIYIKSAIKLLEDGLQSPRSTRN